jgi:hypothetical protein
MVAAAKKRKSMPRVALAAATKRESRWWVAAAGFGRGGEPERRGAGVDLGEMVVGKSEIGVDTARVSQVHRSGL